DVVCDAEAVRRRVPKLVLAEVLELTEERLVRVEEDRRIRADLVRLDGHLLRQVDGLGPRLDDDCLVRLRLQALSDDAPRDVRHALPGGTSRAALIRIEDRRSPVVLCRHPPSCGRGCMRTPAVVLGALVVGIALVAVSMTNVVAARSPFGAPVVMGFPAGDDWEPAVDSDGAGNVY